MSEWLREPAVAGKFYPGTKASLNRELARCMGSTLGDERARVVIAPHAGTMYSGPVAGAVYSRIHVPERCIVLSPNHTGRGARIASWPRGAWRTPLGDIPIDEALAEKLQAACPQIEEDRLAHTFEHSLEVQLPFLQARQPAVRIVALTLGFLTYDECAEVGRAVASLVRDEPEETLIVASTDMSHYIPAEEARALDTRALERVTAIDAQGLYETVRRYDISMCGVIPTTAALSAARALSLRDAELVRYGNSGDASGDYSSVVGYASVKLA